MESYTFLPYFNAVIIEENESSNKIISDASFDISVPFIPIENPM